MVSIRQLGCSVEHIHFSYGYTITHKSGSFTSYKSSQAWLYKTRAGEELHGL